MKIFSKGLIKENPVFVIALGLCPALAVTTTVWNAIGMGLGVIFVLVCSNLLVSLLRNFIPDEIHIPAYIVIIASFVTVVELLMKAFLPSLAESLGIFIPLIVVNCVILGRAEAFASKNTPIDSIWDGLGMGIGFTIALMAIALVREVLGAGTITLLGLGDPSESAVLGFDIDKEGVKQTVKFLTVKYGNGFFGFELPGLSTNPARVFAFPAGALIVMGYFKALFNYMERRSK